VDRPGLCPHDSIVDEVIVESVTVESDPTAIAAVV
jgi:hypothetical protein